MSLREYLGMNEDCYNGAIVALVVSLGAALVISAVAWPVAYYHVERVRVVTEKGYEEAPNPNDRNGTLLKKVDDGKKAKQ